MRLIGLGGYAGAGKDETAKVLVEQHGFTRVAFADPLRQMLYDQNPIVVIDPLFGTAHRVQDIVNSMGWDAAKRAYPEIRAQLQRLGVAARDHLARDVWVRRGFQAALDAGTDVVITDCRFDNECLSVLARCGEVWDVRRPGVGPVNAHVSDAGEWQKHATRTVWNDGTLSDLSYQIFGMVSGA